MPLTAIFILLSFIASFIKPELAEDDKLTSAGAVITLICAVLDVIRWLCGGL